MISPCEECNNLQTSACNYCAAPKFSRFSQRDPGVLFVYIVAALLLAGIVGVTLIIMNIN